MSMFSKFCDAIIAGTIAEERALATLIVDKDVIVVTPLPEDHYEMILRTSVYDRLGLDRRVPFSLDDIGAVITNIQNVTALEIILLILASDALRREQARAAALRRIVEEKIAEVKVDVARVKPIEWPLDGLYENAGPRQEAIKVMLNSVNKATLAAIRDATAKEWKAQKAAGRRPTYTKALAAGLEQIVIVTKERGFETPPATGGQTQAKKNHGQER